MAAKKKCVYSEKRVLKQKSVIKCLGEHYSSHVASLAVTFNSSLYVLPWCSMEELKAPLIYFILKGSKASSIFV